MSVVKYKDPDGCEWADWKSYELLKSKLTTLDKSFGEVWASREDALNVITQERAKLAEHDEIHERAVASMLQGQAFVNQKLKVAVEALEFYGEKSSWRSDKPEGLNDYYSDRLMLNDTEEMPKQMGKTWNCAGKTAREALKKISEGV